MNIIHRHVSNYFEINEEFDVNHYFFLLTYI